MSTQLVTEEDYKFFDFLAPYRWPDKTPNEILLYRELVSYGDLQIETILENALAITSNTYKRIASVGQDFCDGSDAKKVVSQFRNNNIVQRTWTNSFKISGLQNKTGLIRALCFSKYANKFYGFVIPYFEYAGRQMIEVPLDRFSNGPGTPLGIPTGKWTKYLVRSFNELATKTEDDFVNNSNFKKLFYFY